MYGRAKSKRLHAAATPGCVRYYSADLRICDLLKLRCPVQLASSAREPWPLLGFDTATAIRLSYLHAEYWEPHAHLCILETYTFTQLCVRPSPHYGLPSHHGILSGGT